MGISPVRPTTRILFQYYLVLFLGLLCYSLLILFFNFVLFQILWFELNTVRSPPNFGSASSFFFATRFLSLLPFLFPFVFRLVCLFFGFRFVFRFAFYLDCLLHYQTVLRPYSFCPPPLDLSIAQVSIAKYWSFEPIYQ